MKLIDTINPAECLNTRLRMATRKLNQLYNAHIAELGISFGEQSILLMVGKMGQVRQSDIGKRLHLERSTVTRELRGLIKKGYITKYKEEGISPVVHMTNKGQSFLNILVPKWIDAQNQAKKLLGVEGETALDVVNQKLID